MVEPAIGNQTLLKRASFLLLMVWCEGCLARWWG
jgi:hypothetical protein